METTGKGCRHWKEGIKRMKAAIGFKRPRQSATERSHSRSHALECSCEDNKNQRALRYKKNPPNTHIPKARTSTCIHATAPTHTFTCSHTNTLTRIHTYTWVHTHTYTCMHTYALTHAFTPPTTHTHKHSGHRQCVTGV